MPLTARDLVGWPKLSGRMSPGEYFIYGTRRGQGGETELVRPRTNIQDPERARQLMFEAAPEGPLSYVPPSPSAPTTGGQTAMFQPPAPGPVAPAQPTEMALATPDMVNPLGRTDLSSIELAKRRAAVSPLMEHTMSVAIRESIKTQIEAERQQRTSQERTAASEVAQAERAQRIQAISAATGIPPEVFDIQDPSIQRQLISSMMTGQRQEDVLTQRGEQSEAIEKLKSALHREEAKEKHGFKTDAEAADHLRRLDEIKTRDKNERQLALERGELVNTKEWQAQWKKKQDNAEALAIKRGDIGLARALAEHTYRTKEKLYEQLYQAKSLNLTEQVAALEAQIAGMEQPAPPPTGGMGAENADPLGLRRS